MKKWVSWGGTAGTDSFRWIEGSFASTARKLGIETEWVPDRADSRDALTEGTTCFVVDRYGSHVGPARPGVRYVTHNLHAEHELMVSLAETPELHLRLQVWNIDADGKKWAQARSFNREGGVLYQPWGSDLLEEEFLPPVYNRGGAARAVFVGAVWSDIGPDGVDMGNELVTQEVEVACAQLGIPFERRTQIPTDEMIQSMREAALCPGFCGGWQVAHAYLSCRGFKSAAYGQLPLTNVPAMLDLLQGAALRGSVFEVMEEALGMARTRYANLVREAQRAIADYTYASSITAIDRAFKEMRG